MRFPKFAINIYTLVFAAILCSAGVRADFRASVVTIDITPDGPKMLLGYGARQSTGIHDRIYHRIIAMDDGVNQFFLVSSDICVVSPSEYDNLALMLQQKLGINPLNFWWSLTHTHSAPEVGVPGLPSVFMGERYKHAVDTAYTALVRKKLIEGIIEARNTLQPARMGVGWGFAQANINRRAIDTDGKASLGMNPEGEVDRRIGLIRLDKANGKPLALIANYAIHGTLYGASNLEISGDVQGMVSTYVEQKTGVPMLFINGAAGNLAPIYSVTKSPYSSKETELGQFRVLLGNPIIEANKKILLTTDSVKLITGAVVVETPRKKGLGWTDDLAAYTRTTKDGINMVRLPIRFLKINEETAIWSAPLELFCEISNYIRDRSPFEHTFYYGYTNGWLGYLPTADEWKHGGYEVDVVSPYTIAAEKDLTEAVIGYLKGELKAIRPDRSGSETVLASEDGTLRLTAEKGKATGTEIKLMPEWKAFGWFRGKDFVEWTVNVVEEGDYDVFIEYSVDEQEAGKEFLFQSPNQKLTGTVATSGSWEKFTTVHAGRIKLNRSVQKMIFKPNKAFDKGALLDLREVRLVAIK